MHEILVSINSHYKNTTTHDNLFIINIYNTYI